MRYPFLHLALLFSLLGCGTPAADSSIALDPAQGPTILQQQRSTPDSVESFWQVDAKTARAIDANIAQIGSLRTTDGKSVKDPANSLRQYMGIIVDGERLVYINAFPKMMVGTHWRTEAVQTADGGTLIWGATYDPSAQRFGDLSTNACFGSCE